MKTLILLLSLILLSACSYEQKATPKTLRINFQDGDLPSTHPHIAIDYRMRSLQGALFEGLTRMDPQGIPQPAAAEEILISPCQTRYTFKLRKSEWSDGSLVTAHQFASAWKKAIAKDSTCRRPDLFYIIKNAEKIKKGEASIDEAGIYAIDNQTLIIDLTHPAPYFLELISNPIFSPLSELNEKDPTCFNGPFIIDQWKRDESIHLKKNSHYWDKQSVGLDRIEILFITDPLTTVQLFEKGELDWIGSPFSCLPSDMIPAFQNEESFQTKEVARVYWLFCNDEVFPFNNPSIRKALSYAIDRKEIVEHVLLDQAPATTPLPKSLTLLDNIKLPEKSDLLLASKFFEQGLQELGLEKEEFPTITLSHSHITGQKQLAEMIQSSWQKALGVHVKIVGSEWNVFFSDLSRGNYQIGGVIKSALFRDPIYHLELLEDKTHPYNISRWQESTYQACLAEARETTQSAARRSALKKAEEILIDKMPVIPIYSEVYVYMIRPHIQGVVIHDLGHVDFKWINNAL